MPDLTGGLHDGAAPRSSAARLANRDRRTGLALADGSAHRSAARALTQERPAAIRTPVAQAAGTWQKNTMGYFFAVLADQRGRRAREASA
ncbi:MAG: hypothetical protein M3Q65_09105 [Chloroflexota bacterium]|nr:hypothetical protein [Chloroflexota bacterium]